MICRKIPAGPKIGTLKFYQVIAYERTHPYAKTPSQGTKLSAGYDFYSVTHTSIKLNEKKLILTEIIPKFPRKTFGLLKDRSSMVIKRDLEVKAGVIDEDYRGEIFICLQNIGNEERFINIGDKIAQLILLEYKKAKWIVSEEIEKNTQRGDQGFGSTGI